MRHAPTRVLARRDTCAQIERLAALVAAVMRSVDAVVDVGGGKGHLAHVLQHYYAMHVVNLEGHAAHTQRARLRSGDLRQRLWMARQRELKRRGLPHLSKREYVHEEPESRCFEYFLSPDVDAAHFEDELAVFLHGSQSAPILVKYALSPYCILLLINLEALDCSLCMAAAISRPL